VLSGSREWSKGERETAGQRTGEPQRASRTGVVLVLHAAVDDADGHQRARDHVLIGGVEVSGGLEGGGVGLGGKGC